MVDSITRLASALESARSITKEAAAVVSSKLGESSYTHYSQSLDTEQLSVYLNSTNTREVKDAIKRIVATMASGDTSLNVDHFFADVLKNITSNDPKVKRLVYVYLLRYAEKNPDLSLLAVNSIQKLLNDSDPELRCFAIKALSDIKISSLIPIIIHSLKKAVTDPSVVVRSEVVYALLKLYRWKTTLDEDEFDFLDIIETLFQDLLSDSEPRVISACMLLFQNVFTTKLEWLHGHFRYYCSIIKQLDSWSQSALIELFIKYCKRYITVPTVIDPATGESYPLSQNEISASQSQIEMNPDMSLFLQHLLPLRYSPNPLVILSCCNAFYQLTTLRKFKESGFPEALFRVYTTTDNEAIQATILQSILLYSQIDTNLFGSYIQNFFLLPNDVDKISVLKLGILGVLINDMTVKRILHELKYYIIYSHKESTVITSVELLIPCANVSLEWENYIMKWLIKIMESTRLSPAVLDSVVNAIRKLIITNPLRHMKIILKLADILETHPAMADNARAGLIWLFGEISTIEFRICPDILRKLIPSFGIEGVESRNSILLFAAKLLSCEVDKKIGTEGQFNKNESFIAKMYDDIIYLAKFDDDYDVRDRARYISSIFDSQKYQIATLLFQAPKPATRLNISYNSLEKCIECDIKSYFGYQPWNEDQQLDTATDLREPVALKDYNRYKKSISSNSFISKNNISRSFSSGAAGRNINTSRESINAGNRDEKTLTTTATTPKYKLQSLDEFFSDIPPKKDRRGGKVKRTIIVEEDSSTSEATSSEQGEYDTGNDDEETTEEVSSSESSSDDESVNSIV